MSVHYDLFFTFDLKPDLPIQIMNALNYVTGKNSAIENLPQDSKFSIGTWKDLLVVPLHYNMLRFSGHTISVLATAYRYGLPESKEGMVYRQTFTFRHEIKDDVMHEYLLFLGWIAPYSERTGYIGYFLSDLDDFYPVIMHFKDSELIFLDTNPSKQKADG